MNRILWSSLLFGTGYLALSCDGQPPPPELKRIEVTGENVVVLRDDFEQAPAAWEFVEGAWEYRGGAPGSGVLIQTSTDRSFPLALWTVGQFTDFDVSVRFRPLSGETDASGGIVFRARDGGNYYLARANSLEDNFRLYTVVDGRRRQIAGTTIHAPSLGEWHVLRVTAVGSRIQAYLDGRLLIDHRDTTFQRGYVGRWTNAHSGQVERPVRRKWEGRFGASGTGRSEATLEVSSGCCRIG